MLRKPLDYHREMIYRNRCETCVDFSMNNENVMSAFLDVFTRTFTLIANFFGTFGNCTLVVMTIRSKELHFSCGYIIATLSTCNLFCLWGELEAWYRLQFDIYNETLRFCFYTHVPYIFAQFFRIYLIFVAGVDRFLAIWKPLWYRSIPSGRYSLVAFTPGILIALGILVWSFLYIDDSRVPLCQLIPAVPEAVVPFMNMYINVFCVLTCIMYGIIYYQLMLLGKHSGFTSYMIQQKALVGSLVLLFCLFAAAVFLSVTSSIFAKFESTKEVGAVLFQLRRFPAQSMQALDFYIYMWRSAEYRRAFRQIFYRSSIQISSINVAAGSSGRSVR